MRSFRKEFWTILGVLISGLAIFAAYNIYNLSKPTRNLEIIFSSPLSLVSVRPEAVGDINVTYKGEPVRNIFLLQVQIKNAGNQPIAESDYSRPLSFTFTTEYRLVESTINSSVPPNIGTTVNKISEQYAEVSTTLSNPDDVVNFQFVIISEEAVVAENLSIDGRIVGIREIQILSLDEQLALLEDRSKAQMRWILLSLVFICFVVLLILERRYPIQYKDISW